MAEAAARTLEAFTMPFDSMEPSIATGAEVIVDEGYYKSRSPQRWEVVVFTLPGQQGSFIKRIIALPGESVRLTAKGIEVNGHALSPPDHIKEHFSSIKHHEHCRHGSTAFTVPEKCVFVLGDNTAIQVADSREYGAIPINNLAARVVASINLH
jgi:signal peptidase I